MLFIFDFKAANLETFHVIDERQFKAIIQSTALPMPIYLQLRSCHLHEVMPGSILPSLYKSHVFPIRLVMRFSRSTFFFLPSEPETHTGNPARFAGPHCCCTGKISSFTKLASPFDSRIGCKLASEFVPETQTGQHI